MNAAPVPDDQVDGAPALARARSLGYAARLLTRGRPGAVALAQSAAAIVVALLVFALMVALFNFGVGQSLLALWTGAVSGIGAFNQTLRWTIPLVMVGLSTGISFRAGFFNVGTQGQMWIGAAAAAAVGLANTPAVPVIVMIEAALAAMAAAALWALIPGILRVRFGTNEVITTLMMTFIGGQVLNYIARVPLAAGGSSGETLASPPLSDALRLGDPVTPSPVLLAIAVLLLVVAWVMLNRSRFGITATLVGRNPRMARIQGVRVERVGLIVFAVTGMLAGLAGFAEVFGPIGRLTANFDPNIGFTSVVVALAGGLSPIGIGLASLFFGGLSAAAVFLPIGSSLPTSAVTTIEGLITLFVTMQVRLRLQRRQRASAGTPVPTVTGVPEASAHPAGAAASEREGRL